MCNFKHQIKNVTTTQPLYFCEQLYKDTEHQKFLNCEAGFYTKLTFFTNNLISLIQFFGKVIKFHSLFVDSILSFLICTSQHDFEVLSVLDCNLCTY